MRRRDLLVVIAIAWVLVIARSAVFLFYQASFFDSDQAIVGLMAKHLVEGRAFPLFYYGQTYLLGVDAWIAAPFFLVAGASVGALHASVIFTNLVIVTVLVVSLERWCALRPIDALVASLFFAFAPPFTSASLIEAGANIGPFLWVLLLWVARDRPIWFGGILAIGVLNREFTIYAVPALLAVQLIQGTLFRSDRIRIWLLAGAVFIGVWQGVESLKPMADLMGPGTRGELLHGSTGSEVNNIRDRLSIVPSELAGRARTMAANYLPRQVGARYVSTWIATQGRDWMLWPLGLGLIAACLRAVQLARAPTPIGEPARSAAFGWYLLGVGAAAAFAYVLTRPASTGIVDRYLLLTIYAPIGIVAAFLALERRAVLRHAMVALVLMWGVFSAVDHTRLAARYWGGQERDEVQELADGLVARGIRVAGAGYWRAYRVTFLSREQVKVASSDVGRIEEYQRLAAREGDRLLVIREAPCAGDKIGRWYLCREGQ